MPGFVKIGPIGASGELLGIESMDHRIMEELRRIGRKPEEFNTLTWAGVGASRHSQGLILMHKSRVDQLISQTNTLFQFQFDDTLFDRMMMRNPVPVFTTEGLDAVYAVELVDERFLWTQGSVQNLPEALNLSMQDKEKLFDDSEFFDDPWSLTDLLEDILSNELPYMDDPLGMDAWDFSQIDDDSVFTEDIRDIRTRGLSPGALIDKLLQATGHVLLVEPSFIDTVRYRVVPIASGENDVGNGLSTWTNRLLAGGVYSPESGAVLPESGPASVAGGPPEWLASEIPTTVAVHFPLAEKEGAGYDFTEDSSGDGVHYPTNRYHTIMTNFGRPGDTQGNLSTKAVFSTRWAIQDQGVLQDDEILEARAEVYAKRYYDRFRSGVGNMLFAGGIPFPVYSGSHEIVYAANAHEVTTRVRGSYEFALFGFTTGVEPLRATDIFTGPNIRTAHRSDSSVLFDILPGTSNLHYAKITDVSGTVNATYDAEAFDDSSIQVEGAEPIRLFNPLSVNHDPAEVDDPCIIGIRQDGTKDLYTPTEKVQTVDCAQSAAQQQQENENLSLAYHGF